MRIIEYWKTEYNAGKKILSYQTPQAQDMEHARAAIRIFWKLLSKKAYWQGDGEDWIAYLTTSLDQAGLQKPPDIKDESEDEASGGY